MANGQTEKSDRGGMFRKGMPGTGIVFRFSMIAAVSVLVTSIVVALGMELRLARIHAFERRSELRMLAGAIDYGTKNLLASPASYRRIGQVVDEILARAFRNGTPVVSCVISSETKEVYRLKAAPPAGSAKPECVDQPVMSGDKKIGGISLCAAARNFYETERTRQVVTIGNTLATIVRAYMLQDDYFQITDLADKFAREEPNILFITVMDADGAVIHSNRPEKLTGVKGDSTAVTRRVSVRIPVWIETAGVGGGIIDASHLIDYRGRKLGSVRICYSLKSLRAELLRERRRMALYVLAAAAAALLLSILAARNLAAPVRRLSGTVLAAAAQAPGRGIDFAEAEAEMTSIIDHYNTAAADTKKRGDELGGLANSFSALLEKLRGRFRELNRLYRKMSQADRLSALGRLAAGIAHEINNPLTIISTSIQMMQRDTNIDPELKEDVTIIHEEIQRIAGKVKELLSFAQEHQPEMHPERVADFLADTTRLTRHELKKNNVALAENYEGAGGAEVSIDQNQMRQVFLNLILNSVHAMKDTGGALTVTACVKEAENAVEISVADTGEGIAPENIQRIFDPFFTTKPTGEGTGLGLAIAYRIVQLHGGEITVESAPGAGTTFTVTLPAAAG